MNICIPLHLSSEKELFKVLKKVKKKAKKYSKIQFIEIGLDELENQNIKKIKEAVNPYKAIFAYRKKINFQKIKNLIEQKAEYLDIDIKNKKIISKLNVQGHFSKKPKINIIISYHDYQKTPFPEKLEKIAEQCYKLGADIVKIAAMVNEKKDIETLLVFLKNYRKKYPKRKIIVHGMGKKAKKSRIHAAKGGSYIFYAALNEKLKTAKGQWILEELEHKI